MDSSERDDENVVVWPSRSISKSFCMRLNRLSVGNLPASSIDELAVSAIESVSGARHEKSLMTPIGVPRPRDS